MSKAVIAAVSLAAFFYALWLLLVRRMPPRPEHSTGLHHRFLVATAMFLGLFGGSACKKKPVEPMCYSTAVLLKAADAADRSAAKEVPLPAPIKTLAEMKTAVERILQQGPPGNDWHDPEIKPNIYAILGKVGLLQRRQIVSCYDRSVAPVPARSRELLQLQKTVLDRAVTTGVLPVEVAKKAEAAARRLAQDQVSSHRQVRAYQKKVRRIVRWLYKQGELPSAYVQQLAQAVELELIAFDSAKALRNDVHYHLRTIGHRNGGSFALAMLQKRGLIPKAKNHRARMRQYGQPEPSTTLSPDEALKLQALADALDGKVTVRLAGDATPPPKDWQAPGDELTYRWKMRGVLRALVHAKLTPQQQLAPLQEVIGYPIAAKITPPR